MSSAHQRLAGAVVLVFCLSLASANDGEGRDTYVLVSGGKPCQLNVECGIPSANLQTEREYTASLSGSCENGRCVCATGSYGCDSCWAQVVGGTTLREFLSPPNDELFDLCSVDSGGGVCAADSECYHGLCIKGKCVCYSGWVCPYCQLDANTDLLNHAECGDFITGGAQCEVIDDCNVNGGICEAGLCKCSAGWSCEDCTVPAADIIAGTAECSCPEDHCNGHGTCSGGVCECDSEWSGSRCTVNICDDVDCGGHGTCVRGECECDSGFFGPNCDKGGDTCASNEDCGVWAPIELLPGEENRECEGEGVSCTEGKYGGSCISGRCICNAGFACGDCSAKGGDVACRDASGGGPCITSEDCKPEGAENAGGFCWNNRCICYAGFSCPRCQIEGSLPEGGECPVFDPSQARGGAPCQDDLDCGVFRTGTGGKCIDGHCSCWEGFFCPTCNTKAEEGEEVPFCTAPFVGEELCQVDNECGNGVCAVIDGVVGGRCLCNGGYACDHCEGKVLNVGSLKPGKCQSEADCGSDELIGGSCINGVCECYNGFICSHCQHTMNGGQDCPDSDYVQEGDPVECGVRNGGKRCEVESEGCGLLVTGDYGGLCSAGACSCYGGYTCADCALTFEQVAGGMPCPELLTGAAQTSVSLLVTVLAALAAAMAVA